MGLHFHFFFKYGYTDVGDTLTDVGDRINAGVFRLQYRCNQKILIKYIL